MQKPDFKEDIASISKLEELSHTLVKQFRSQQLVLLYGDVGAGKTQMVHFMCLALGVPSNEIQSPSFSFINEYSSNKTSEPIYHVDLFRLKSVEELDRKGFWDLFHDPFKVIFIEWPDLVENLLPENPKLRLSFDLLNLNRTLKGEWFLQKNL